MRGPQIRARAGQRWDNRAQYARAAISADQLEWQAVLHGSAHVMVGTMDEEMAEEADQSLEDGIRIADSLEGKNRVLELAQGQAMEIILERHEQLGDAYPFQFAANSLRHAHSRDELPLYELLLGISQAPSLTTGLFVKLPRLFEDLSKLAGMAFLGPAAVGFRTGWPRPDTHTRFKSVIEALRANTGGHGSEWEWRASCERPDDPAPALVKDAGLDIVAWRPWADRRGAHLYLLGQCACGADWQDKTRELDLEALGEWVHRPRVAPVRSFFIPRYAVTQLLYEHSRAAGLIFDRPRIVSMLREPHIRAQVATLGTEIYAALAIAKNESPAPAQRRARTAKKAAINPKRSAMPRQRP